MALLTRISVGGVGKSYGTVANKSESGVATSETLTRISVGGVGQKYSVTDKNEAGSSSRITRIGVGGVGLSYTISAKAEADLDGAGKKIRSNGRIHRKIQFSQEEVNNLLNVIDPLENSEEQELSSSYSDITTHAKRVIKTPEKLEKLQEILDPYDFNEDDILALILILSEV